MIQFMIGSLIGMGIFFIACDYYKIPLLKTSKTFHSAVKRQNKKSNSIELWLQDFTVFISKIIKINEYKRMGLVSDLQTAGLSITPELHIASAIVKSGLCGALSIPMFFIFPILVPVIVTLAVAIYFKESKGIEEKIKVRRQAIEYELPHFVFFIEKTLIHARDVLAILDNYRDNAGDVFKYELHITVADMRSGNYEAALTRLESRVGSAMLSDVVRGLISVLRGDDTTAYWQSLSIKFADIQRQQLKAQAARVPSKVRRLSMILLFCFMAIYLVVMITEIISSLGAMFG